MTTQANDGLKKKPHNTRMVLETIVKNIRLAAPDPLDQQAPVFGAREEKRHIYAMTMGYGKDVAAALFETAGRFDDDAKAALFAIRADFAYSMPDEPRPMTRAQRQQTATDLAGKVNGNLDMCAYCINELEQKAKAIANEEIRSRLEDVCDAMAQTVRDYRADLIRQQAGPAAA